MKDALRAADEFPVTIVVAIAYLTLAVVTGMLGDPEEFHRRIEEYGVLVPALVADGQVWRLGANMFLHLSLVHVLVNLMSLWAIGPGLEQSLGSVRFAALYLLAGLGGSVAVCLVYHPEAGAAGGSGALFGMLGAAVAMNMRSGRHAFAFLEFEGPRRLLGLIAFNLGLGFLIPYISNTAHLGGLIAGFVITLLWLHPGAPSPARRRWRLAVGAALFTLTAWTLAPVTREDSLVRQARNESDPQRRVMLFLAWQRAQR